MGLQKKIFLGGMDWDTSFELLPEGRDYLRANVRVLSSDNGNEGSIETMNGNTAVTTITPSAMPSGTNTVIGAKEDKLRNKVYYFVHNDLVPAQHLIMEYDSQANSMAKVFQDPLLNFHTDNLITGIDIVELDTNNHLLYWTDNRNEPRKINIEKGKYYTAGNFTLGYPTPFEARWITRVKQPCPTPPIAHWSNQATQKINYLFKKNFTFKSLFVYDDGEESAYSPVSNFAFPVTTQTGIYGEDIATQENTLRVIVKTGSAIVKKIRIVAKEVNSPDYVVIAELDKSVLGIGNNTTYDYAFFNNGNYIPVEVNQSIKLFDNVPQLSKAQTIISGNRIVDGNITEGYDKVDLDVRFPLSYATIVAPANPHFPAQSNLKSGGVYKLGLVYYDEYGNRSGTTNVVNEKTTNLIDSSINKYGTTLCIPFLTDTNYSATNPLTDVPVVLAEIYHRPPTWAKYYQILRSKNEAMDRYIQFAAENVMYVKEDKSMPIAPASATYVKVFIGNITSLYKDENENSKLVYDFIPGDRIRFIANNHWTTLIPFAPVPLAPAGGNDFAYNVAQPPSSSTTDPLFAFNDNEIMSYDSGTGALLIQMNSNIPNNLLPGVMFEIYQPSENVIENNEIMYEMGECREVTLDVNGVPIHNGTVNQKYVFFASSTYIAPTFVATVGSGHGLIVGQKVKITTTGYSVFGVVTVSAALSVTIDTTGFTLIGTFNGVLTGEIVVAATFDLTGGDCFKRYQNMPFNVSATRRLYAYVESENVSNMFASKWWNVGRPNRIDPGYKRITRPSTVYYSEPFIPETNINGLSSVFDTSFQSYEDKYGGIQKFFNKNHQLTVYQELKVGWLPTGQVIFNGTNGGSVVGQSADVLPEVMEYYAGEYGIGTNPESHAFYGNVEYFMDVKRGTPLRLSNDGLTPIGDTAFMHNFFTDLCDLILASSGKRINIFGTYDIKFGEYVIAFMSFTSRGASVPSKTLGFNEKNNAWSSFYSYKPEFMCQNGINLLSFKSGIPYTHNTNTLQANFYGQQFQPEVWTVLNAEPSNVKVLKAISQETNSAWESYKSTDATYGINGNNNGQLTILASTDYTMIEGLMYAPLFRDVNTPVTNPLWEGDEMRDTTFLVKLRYPLTSYNKLFAVNLKYIASNLHGSV